MKDRLLTMNEVARIFRVSERTIRRQIGSGEFPQPFRVGRQYRWHPAQIREFIGTPEGAESEDPADWWKQKPATK